MVKWFAKANDDVLSHCRCSDTLAATTGQTDCPWCGCGWLISCRECHKAFVFAKIVEVDATYDQLLAEDAQRRGLKSVTQDDIRDVAASMERALAPFPIGATIVYLDGEYFLVDATNIEFEGLYARHKLERLPHAIALEQPEHLRAFLSDTKYWLAHERPNRHDE